MVGVSKYKKEKSIPTIYEARELYSDLYYY